MCGCAVEGIAMTGRFRAWLLIALLLVLAAPPRVGRAQQDNAVAYPVTPGPADCIVERRTTDELRALASPSTAVAATPTAAIAETPAGSPADAATIAAIVATVTLLAACSNAEDPLAILAIYSDAFVHALLDQSHPTADQIASLNEPPTPLAATAWATVCGVWDVRLSDDAHATALVYVRNPHDDLSSGIPRYAFVYERERWRIDAMRSGGGQAGLPRSC